MRKIKLTVIFAITISIFASSVLANVPETAYTPSLSVQKANQSIKIDGKISDSEWQSATAITSFIEREPGENTTPIVKTETFITYDENNLYVSFKCYDDPALIRASMTQRDQYSGNDQVGVLIDTYGDASVAYMLYVNPFGVQKDFLWNSITGYDIGYDLIWKSSAQITDFGYEVEMAIPFSSLRFPNKHVQSWKVDFRRDHPRESSYQYAWAAHDRNEQCGPCQWGRIDGISSVKPGKGIEILPAYVGNQDHQFTDNDLENLGFESEVALTGKYAISSDVTLEGSINPDFSQIEADAAQIDVNSTHSLFFRERRPFFQEGADIFRTMFNSFYTRTIFNPQYITKLTGRPGSFRFGLVSAYDDSSAYIIPLEENDMTFKASKSYVNILRGLKSIGRNSRVGFMFNDRRYEGEEGSNTIIALDADINLTKSLRFEIQTIYSYTNEGTDDIIPYDSLLNIDTIWNDGSVSDIDSTYIINKYDYDGDYTLNFDNESYGGIATISRLRYATRTFYGQIGYNQLDPKYRTQTGFDPVNNHRSADFYTQYQFLLTDGLFERITPQASGFSRWDMQTGINKIQNYNVGINANLRVAQTFVGLNYSLSSELYNGKQYDDAKNISINVNSQLTSILGLYGSISFSDAIARGVNRFSDRITINGGYDLKLFNNLNIEPSVRYVRGVDSEDKNVELYKQIITRSRVSWQVNRKLSIRVVGQYVESKNSYDIGEAEYGIIKSKSFDIDPLITYRLNPFTVFYFGMVNNYDEGDYTNNLNKYNYTSYDLRENQRKFFFKLQYLFQT